MKYKNRVVDRLLERKLQGKGAVLIEGAKWCGKTTTARQQAASVLDLGNSEVNSNSRQIAAISPSILLQGKTPRLIDEWQTIPALWDLVRSEVDNRGEMSQFILIGSSVPVDPRATLHSGTGRFARIMMRPMTLFESGESDGKVSIRALFDEASFEPFAADVNLEEVAFLTCRGGWPQAVDQRGEVALDQALDYYDAVVEKDIQRIDDTRRNAQRARLLMRSYARNIAQQVPFTTIRKDMLANDTETLDVDTVADYVGALKRLFVIEDLEAWNPNIRSKAAIRTSDTRHFVDPSIATAALGLGPSDLMNDLQTFGLMFENMAVRDLRVYAEAIDARLFHYRDSSGLECDAVMHRRNGSYALIEVKLGGESLIEEAAKTLNALAANIDTARMPPPSFKMVLVAVAPFAYARPDGVIVVPLTSLRD